MKARITSEFPIALKTAKEKVLKPSLLVFARPILRFPKLEELGFQKVWTPGKYKAHMKKFAQIED